MKVIYSDEKQYCINRVCHLYRRNFYSMKRVQSFLRNCMVALFLKKVCVCFRELCF